MNRTMDVIREYKRNRKYEYANRTALFRIEVCSQANSDCINSEDRGDITRDYNVKDLLLPNIVIDLIIGARKYIYHSYDAHQQSAVVVVKIPPSAASFPN